MEFRQSLRLLARGLIATSLLLPAFAHASDPVTEHALKAAVATRITKFVTWPDSIMTDRNSPIRFCVVDDGPVHEAFVEMQDSSIHGREVHVILVSDTAYLAERCHVLYISESGTADQASWIAEVADNPVLTFGEGDISDEATPIVSMGTRRNRVVFEINVEARERSGHSISAQLLQLSDQLNSRGP